MISRRLKTWSFALFLLIALAAAWHYSAHAPAHPQEDPRALSGLPVTTVKTPEGHVLRVEIVRTRPQMERGLMFRKQVPSGTGMLFVYKGLDYRQIWMKNTLVDLDILWLDANHRITNIARNVPHYPPGKTDGSPAIRTGYGQYVLELPAGESDKLHLKKGMRLDFDV